MELELELKLELELELELLLELIWLEEEFTELLLIKEELEDKTGGSDEADDDSDELTDEELIVDELIADELTAEDWDEFDVAVLDALTGTLLTTEEETVLVPWLEELPPEELLPPQAASPNTKGTTENNL
jgi:hypothetical protein